MSLRSRSVRQRIVLVLVTAVALLGATLAFQRSVSAVVGDGTIKSTVKITGATANGATLADSDGYGAPANIGDLNNDGVIDVAVGVSGDDTGGAGRGAVYIHFMNTDGSIDSTAKIASGTANGPTLTNSDAYGVSVAGIGDLDADGVEDIVVGARGDDNSGTDRGAIHIHYLNSNGTVKSTVEINDATTNGPVLGNGFFFGASVAAIGDLDNDGVTDLVVGAPYSTSPSNGAVFLMYMNTNGTIDSTIKISTSTANGPTLSHPGSQALYGSSVTPIGDLNGDTVEDMVVGATSDYYTSAGPNGASWSGAKGSVFVHFMNTNGTISSTAKISGSTANGAKLYANTSYGSGVANAGDVNDDGVTDLLVGAATSGQDTGLPLNGEAFIHFLNTNGTLDATKRIGRDTINGPFLYDDGSGSPAYGSSVAALGDLDSDGIEDIVVSASGDDDGGSSRGSLFVHYLQSPTNYLRPMAYRWGNNDAGTFAAAENTSLAIGQGVVRQLTFSARSVEGGDADFRLEYGLKSTTCQAVSSWTQVPATATSEHWEMADTSYFTDGDATSDSAVSNRGYTFVAGEKKDTGSQTTGITLTTAQMTEVTYAVRPTANATVSNAYCFRVTDAGNTVSFSPNADDYSYTASAVAFAPQTLDGGATTVSLADEAMSASISLPFTFSFYGQAKTSLKIGSNGAVTFLGQASPCCEYGDTPIPRMDSMTDMIAGNFIDLDPSLGGTIKYQTFGTVGSRVFVVEFSGVYLCCSVSEPTQTFQIMLFETSNRVEIHSASTNSNGGSVVQGIENRLGTSATTYTGRNSAAFTLTNDAVRFTYDANAFAGYAEASITSSSTTPVKPSAYRWRNDDGSESTATFAEAANTPTSIAQESGLRVRFAVKYLEENPASLRLEYGEKSTTCEAIGAWTQVPATATTEDWEMFASTNITDGEATTDSAVPNGGASFVAGEAMDASSQTSSITLADGEVTEVEYSIQPTTNATVSATYCFRITDAGYFGGGGASAPSLTSSDSTAGGFSYNYNDTTVIDPAGGYAYFVPYNGVTGTVHKVDLATGLIADTLELPDPTDTSVGAAAIDTTNGFLYLFTDTSPSYAIKVSLTSFTKVDDVMLSVNAVESAAIDVTNGYLYGAAWDTDSMVVKVDLSTFTEVGAVALDSTEDNAASLVLDEENGMLYVGVDQNPGKVIKVDTNGSGTPVRVGAITLNSGESALYGAFIDTSGATNYAYFVTWTNPSYVIKVDLGTFTRDSAVTLTGAAVHGAVDTDTGKAYLAKNEGTSGVFVLDLATMTEDFNVTFASGSYGNNIVFDPVRGNVVAVTDESPMQVQLISLNRAAYAEADVLAGGGGGSNDPTLANTISLTRLKQGVTTTASLSFDLQNTLTGTLTVTFPAGFTVTGPFTSGACSGGGTIGTFGYTAQTLTAVKAACAGTVTLSGATVTNPGTPGAYTVTWVNDDPGETVLYIVDDDQVTVTANVDPYLTFNAGAQDDATACAGSFSGNGGTLALGVLTTDAVTSSDASGVDHICTRLSTNATSGAMVTVRSLNGANGLVSTSVPADDIDSSSGTAVAGTENYGLCAGSAGGDSGNDAISGAASPVRVAPFEGSCASGSHVIGGLTTSPQQVWTLASPSVNAFVRLYVKAAISPVTAAHADYTDTLTFIATGTF